MSLNKLLPLLLLVLTTAFTGCVNDDRSDCYFDNNCELLFEYSAAASSQFPRFISSVDAFVFDEKGYYVASKRSDQSELEQFRGVRMTLDPGKYYVVAWANVGERTVYNGSAGTDGSFTGYEVEIPANQTETGDQLYYAPLGSDIRSRSGDISSLTSSGEMDVYEVIVPYGRTVTKKLDFVRAHRSIHVWSRGYKDIQNGNNICPTAEASNLWTRYDFMCRTFDERRDFRQQGSETEREGVTYSLSTFHFAYGDITDNMDVHIYRTSDNRFIETVNVKDFIENNPATGTEDIHIMVTFTDDDDMTLGVNIKLPPWIEKELTPGID